jgi:putative transposase
MGFIDTMRAQGFAVESICQVLREQGLQVAARTYRVWKAPGRQVAARTISDAVVADALLHARTSSDGRPTPESLYGRRKMTALLRRRGLDVAHCTVDRLMRELGMHGVRRGKQPRTTISRTDPAARAGDLLDRDFTAPAPNRVWIADFTYVGTWAAMVYVAFVVDLYAQRIVGWHAMSTRPAELVLLPLRMAAWARGQQGHPIVRGELVHHSDAGSQYTAIRFTEHLQLEGITPSVGSVGDAYDNALMESIIGLYKTECVRPGPFHTGPFKTLSDVEFATMAWVDWYNHRRLHATLGMRTPAEQEAAHYTATAALQPEPQPV